MFESSVYPEEFEPSAEFAYDEEGRELGVVLHLPSPDGIPNVRAFKYVKARDEITETELPQKDQRDRYASLIYSIVLRTLHEQFEAGRPGGHSRSRTREVLCALESRNLATSSRDARPLKVTSAQPPVCGSGTH